MKITSSMLSHAVDKKIISLSQATELEAFFDNYPQQNVQFNISHSIYYFGGMLAISAMSIFMTYAWESFGGFGILGLCVCYAIIGLGFASKFQSKGFIIPAGICATFVIVLTPLAVFGLQIGLGIWPDNSHYHDYHLYVQWQWLFMELATLMVGLILAYIYRYPFMIMPIAFTLWYLSMDLTAWLSNGEAFDLNLRSLVSMYFGLLIIGSALWVDLRSRKTADYAYWLYLFGVMAFWVGLSCQQSTDELSKFIYFLINIGMIFIGVALIRKVFVTFGAIGCALYIGHLAFDLFEESTLFPVILSAIGFAIIYLGTIWQKYEARITRKIQRLFPLQLQKLLARNKI